MIRPPSWAGTAAFSESADGDLRADHGARSSFSARLGIAREWAFVEQVHGARVVQAKEPGDQGPADGIWTAEGGCPVAIFTADCFAVVMQSDTAVGIAHAGWRGASAGVVSGLRRSMADAGHDPETALIGPGIGPCCFEVGLEVQEKFPENLARTTWGTPSVDLVEAITGELEGLRVWAVEACTMHGEGWFSHRGDGTPRRMAAVAWL
ncbi:MAG: laccase domain-containing protein [Actinobacteria bacterium]|nr:MAG: laccase domain-containing protein [Actinomycetota bacterium]